MANQYEVLFRLDAELERRFSTSFTGADEKMAMLAKRSAELNEAASKIDGLLKLRRETGALFSDYSRQKAVVDNLRSAMSRLQEPSLQMQAALVQEERKLAKVKSAFDRQSEALRKANVAMAGFGRSTTELTQKQAQLVQGTEEANRALAKFNALSAKQAQLKSQQQAIGEAAVQSAVAVATLGRAAVNALSAPVRQAMDMQDAMADINKVVDFEDPKGLQKMQATLEKMSLEIPMSAVGLAQIAAAAGQAGIAADELVPFAEQAAKMGVAFDITAEEAGNMMAKWRSSMGLTQAQALELADATNALSNSNAAQAKQIGEVLLRYGALGKVAGLTEKQTAALAATAIGAGAEAEVAATGINAFMRSMVKGGGMTELQATAFSNIGFDPTQLQKDVQTNAPKAILDVLEAIKAKVPKELQSQYLTAMFGEEGARAMGPLMVNTEVLRKNFEMVADSENYAGSMLKEFESRVGTASNALTIAQNGFAYITGAMGEPLLEPVREFFLALGKGASVIGGFMKENQGLTTAVVTLGLSVAGAALAFHAVRAAVLFTKMPFIAAQSAVISVQKALMTSTAAAKAWSLACVGASKTVQLMTVGARGLGAALSFAMTNPTGAVLAVQRALLGLKASIVSSTVATKAWSLACAGTSKAMALMAVGARGVGVALRFAMANPIGIAISAVSALVAAGVYLYKNWDAVKAKMASIGQAIGAAFAGLVNFVKAPINSIIGMINQVIAAINSLGSFKVPDWVPGIGGQQMGLSIPQIPQLAAGGVATAPTMAMVGEGAEPEAIIPLSQLADMIKPMPAAAPASGTGGGLTVNFSPVINISGGEKDAYEAVRRGLNEAQRSFRREFERMLAEDERLSYA